MNKEETLEAIKKAKEAHNLQMEKLDKVINGEEVKNPTALSKKECDFGQWLYGEDSQIKRVVGIQFYEKLDAQHEKWHLEYKKLYDIFFAPEKKKGLFSKIFSTNSISGMELDKAKLYYAELKETTADLLKVLASCERRIGALCESKFS